MIFYLFYSLFLFFFASFVIVGSFWSKHNFLMNSLEKVNSNIIWKNYLFLFFLSLIPVFTKWVLENPEELVPVFSYDILFLFVNSTFILLAKSAVNKKKLHDLYEKHHEENDNEKSILNLIIMAFIVLVLVVIAILKYLKLQ